MESGNRGRDFVALRGILFVKMIAKRDIFSAARWDAPIAGCHCNSVLWAVKNRLQNVNLFVHIIYHFIQAGTPAYKGMLSNNEHDTAKFSKSVGAESAQFGGRKGKSLAKVPFAILCYWSVQIPFFFYSIITPLIGHRSHFVLTF